MLPAVNGYEAYKAMDTATMRQYMRERRLRGMTDAEIFREAGFSQHDIKLARWLLCRRGITREALRESSICWECDNACGGCSWSRSFTPVEGWTAVISPKADCPSKEAIRRIPWYLVRTCPEFVQDPRFIKQEEI